MTSLNQLHVFIETFVSRRNDFALQRNDGGYVRAGRAISPNEVHRHLLGAQTIGSYVIDEHGCCRYGVFDADSEDGLDILRRVQGQLAAEGVASHLERSRRGGHLWVFLAPPTRASAVRAWLLPFCSAGVEFYPKQNEGRGFGSLIRLPLGMHRLSGKRYPFVQWSQGCLVPVVQSVTTSFEWIASLERVTLPRLDTFNDAHEQSTCAPQEKSFSKTVATNTHLAIVSSIRAWCAQQDPYMIIGHVVALNSRGQGCCPFGWHHANGRDEHASFKVYAPGAPGGYCWYCYVWQQGGSVFDFLRYSYHLDAHTLWQQIQAGGVKW
jgi:hypothetical protein